MVRQLLAAYSSLPAPATATFTTRTVPPRERFDAWRQHNLQIVEISPGDDPTDEFTVDHWSWDLGGVTLERTLLPGNVERRWRHLPRSYRDQWCVVVARDGSRVSVGSGTASEASVGIRSLVQPFEGRGRDREIITLFLPRDRFAREAAALDRHQPGDLSPGAASVLSSHLTTLTQEIGSLPRVSWADIGAASCALVAACLATTPDAVAEGERPVFSALRERARRIVRTNMASPDFGPDGLARLLFVSRSKLYRIFEPNGGVARFIQRERLGEAHRRLTMDTDPISIHALSMEVGFRDHSAFSRAYKSEYGCSPRESREGALASCLVRGAANPAAAASPGPDEAPTEIRARQLPILGDCRKASR